MNEHDEPSGTSIAWFRDASPYIEAHRGRTIVIALPGRLLRSDVLPRLTEDLTLLGRLGLRIVLCFGLRAQLDDSVAAGSDGARIVDGRRVTDDAALDAVITGAGRARTDLEARLSRGLPNTPMAGSPLAVGSGNFVTARPFGIHDGIDFQHTGTVRDVRVTALRTLLDAGHLVLLPPLGHSLTGDVFNLPVGEVAERVAVALGADKLVWFVDALPRDESGHIVRQSSADRMNPGPDGPSREARLARILERACRAARVGVGRVHLLDEHDPDALIAELFSRDGRGTMITAERWDNVRDAVIDDVGGLMALIAPQQESGALLNRSREQLELDIDRFVVAERDGTVIACAALHPHADAAEIACIATHPAYRDQGWADTLLALLEARAKAGGATRVLLLSTRAGHWFVERGYLETTLDALPAARRASYNPARNSRVYEKPL